MNNETYCEFVSNTGIALNCDVYDNKFITNKHAFNYAAYSNICNNDKVYVVTSVLNCFVTKILPELEKKKIKIILVTGSSDRGAPNEISKKHHIKYCKILLNSSSLIHWFTQNYDLKDSNPKITPIPIGIDYYTLKIRKNFWWGPRMSPKAQEKQLIEISKTINFDERQNKTFSFFHFQMFRKHDSDRYRAIESLEKVNFNDNLKSRTNRKDTWKICCKYKFIISPHGKGLDCHRTYESMYLGCIPIVRSSSLDLLYKDMPVIILKKWDDLDMNELLKKSETLVNINKNKLTLKYWIDLINSYIPNN